MKIASAQTKALRDIVPFKEKYFYTYSTDKFRIIDVAPRLVQVSYHIRQWKLYSKYVCTNVSWCHDDVSPACVSLNESYWTTWCVLDRCVPTLYHIQAKGTHRSGTNWHWTHQLGQWVFLEAEKWTFVPGCLKKNFTFILQQKCKIVHIKTQQGFFFWPVYSEVTGRKEGRWAECAGDTLNISDCRQRRKQRRLTHTFTQPLGSLHWLYSSYCLDIPRVYPTCACKQLLEINRYSTIQYSTAHARLLN